MPKVTYLLINISRGQMPWPTAVNGLQTIGHAEYDPKYDAHVFRVSEERWLGGLDRELAEHGNRKFNRWIIRAEVAPDDGSSEAELIELRARVAELEAQKDAGWQDLVKDWPKDRVVVDVPLDDIPPFSSVIPPADGPPSTFEGEPPTVPPSYLEMDPTELKAEIARLNAEGAGIETDLRSRVGMRKALDAHYAKGQKAAA